jgi:hypothetical protein
VPGFDARREDHPQTENKMIDRRPLPDNRMTVTQNAIILLSLFSRLVASRTSADLIPPFYPNQNGNLGYWEIGGATQIEHDAIMLAPPVQFHKGHIWTNAQVPLDDWKMELDFLISESNGGGGFAIWIIDKYGADGPLFGGPSSFAGVAVHARIRPAAGGNMELEFRIIQNPSSLKPPLLKFLPTPIAVVEFTPSTRFIVTIGFTGSEITLEYNETEVGRVPLQSNLSENFIGITAASEDRHSRIDLLMLHFHVKTMIGARDSLVWDHKPLSYFQPAEHFLLKRPYFNKTLAEYEASQAAKGEITSETTAPRIFEVIDEVNEASFEVASFSELNFFVNDNLLMYGEKWQRRTLKIVERVRESRNVAASAWNYTNSVMETFNRTLKDSVLKTTGKIDDLRNFLAGFSADGIDEGHALGYLADDVNQSPVITYLMAIAFIELISLFAFLLMANIPCVGSHLLYRTN